MKYKKQGKQELPPLCQHINAFYDLLEKVDVHAERFR